MTGAAVVCGLIGYVLVALIVRMRAKRAAELSRAEDGPDIEEEHRSEMIRESMQRLMAIEAQRKREEIDVRMRAKVNRQAWDAGRVRVGIR